MDYDVIIVGGGLSGLSAGIRLAHYGKKVAVFEKHSLPGGLNSYFYRSGHPVDVGLHALTNFSSDSDRSSPLNKLLRQLRIRREALDLTPQKFSLIQFPGCTLRMTNDFSEFEAEVAEHFPESLEGFRSLVQFIRSTDYLSPEAKPASARKILAEYLPSQLLQNMIFCPVMFYGNSRRDDMDFNQFCIMFNSLFIEGLGRPRQGMKFFIDTLVQRFREEGGELLLNHPVEKIQTDGLHVTGILSGGRIYTAGKYLSTTGLPETEQLCSMDRESTAREWGRPGELGFTETIFVLKRRPSEFCGEPSIIFRNDQEHFYFAPPENLVDMRSQVICFPGNYQGCAENPSAWHLRLTHLANPSLWFEKTPAEYRAAKQEVIAAQKELLERLWPGISADILKAEMFTPKTILRFTGHLNGAIYGSPDKLKSGATVFDNLYVAGTDQGFLGITGSMLSGTVIANRHLME